jgi:hypothetical protein
MRVPACRMRGNPVSYTPTANDDKPSPETVAQHYLCPPATHQGLLEPDAGTTRQSGSEGGSAG